jgi:hypothetical protein
MSKILVVTTEADFSLNLIIDAVEKTNSWKVKYCMYSQDLQNIAGLLSDFKPDVIYLRDPFYKGYRDPDLDLKLNYLTTISDMIYIDNLKSMHDIYMEDKWLQYELFSNHMPYTKLFINNNRHACGKDPVYKKRLSFRSKDTSFVPPFNPAGYIIQEKLDILKEFSVFSINKKILNTVGVKDAESVNFEEPEPDLISFTKELDGLHKMQIVEYNIALVSDKKYKLIKLKRSPQFAAYYLGTAINIFSEFLK